MPFVQRFDPNDGDVIYGLTSVRQKYLELLLANRREDAIADGDPPDQAVAEYSKFLQKNCFIQIDDLNNKAGVSYQKNFIGDVETFRTGQERFTGNAGGVAAKRYAQGLNSTRFTSEGVFDVPGQKLAQEGHAARNFPKAGDGDAMAASFNRLYLAIRRACKYGLFYVASVSRRGKVHFALDEIDLAEVVKKGVRDKLGDSEVTNNVATVPITTSELRCAYRHWGRLAPRVFFYDTLGTDVLAPWVANPGLWNDYGKRLIEKYLKLLQVAEGEFTQCYRQHEVRIRQDTQLALAAQGGPNTHAAVMSLQGLIDLFPESLRARAT